MFKKGDYVVANNTGSCDAELVSDVFDGKIDKPVVVTSVSPFGHFLRFNNSGSGWTARFFRLATEDELVAANLIGARGNKGRVGPCGPTGIKGIKGQVGPCGLPRSKYERTLLSLDGTKVTTDIYRVLEAFGVTDPALAHAAKKILCAGLRGHKDLITDLEDVIDSVQKCIVKEKQK